MKQQNAVDPAVVQDLEHVLYQQLMVVEITTDKATSVLQHAALVNLERSPLTQGLQWTQVTALLVTLIATNALVITQIVNVSPARKITIWSSHQHRFHMEVALKKRNTVPSHSPST